MPDSEYIGISKDKVKKVLKSTSVDNQKYKKSVGDCDDFAFLLKAEFIKEAWNERDERNPYAFGILWGEVKLNQGWVNHAINWFVTHDHKIYLVEPQADEVFRPTEENCRNIFFLYI